MQYRLEGKRDMAEGLLQDLYNTDVGLNEGEGLSIDAAVDRVGAEAIHFIWGENDLAGQVPELCDHLREYPDGVLVQTLQHVVEQLAGSTEEKNTLLHQYHLLG